MIVTLHTLVASTSLLATPAAAADDVSVTRHGFCIRRDEMRCEEVALPGTMVAFDRLTKLEDGTRVAWFFTDQELPSKAVLVHVLEAEDSDTVVAIKSNDAKAKDAKKIEGQLKKLGAKIAGQGSVQLTPIRASSDKSFRIFTPIVVEGPGIFTGKITDLDGNIVPMTEKTSFSVFRRPSQ